MCLAEPGDAALRLGDALLARVDMNISIDININD